LVHDGMILSNDFALGMKVSLYDWRLHLFSSKLRSCWIGLFVISHVFSYGVVKVQYHVFGANNNVNGQIL